MKKEIIMDKYPIFTLEIGKDETTYATVDAIVDYFKALIADDPVAAFIGIFDHYAHTSSLEGGEIAPDILDAKNVVFCFGPRLPDARILAVRPRSIGIAEKAGCFVISFLEAPMQPMTEKMERWAKNVKNKG